MPKLIDYADRFDGIRDAVYAITLEQGVEGITLDAVAERLQMSPRTIRRLIASVDVLPVLGLQWAERRQVRRLLRRGHQAASSTLPRSDQALDKLLEQLPGRDDAEDRRVWWHLVLAHATSDWARAARVEQERALAELSVETLGDLGGDEVRVVEATRLHFLVSGAISQICLGAVTYGEAAETIRRHVTDVVTSRAMHGDAA